MINKKRIPWNKGKKNIYSDETLKKISDGAKGRIPWNKGMKGEYHIHSKEHKEKLRKSFIGNKLKQGISPWNKNTKGLYKSPKSKEVRKRISKSLKGHECYNDKKRGKKISVAKIEYYKNNEHPKGMLGKKQSKKFMKMRRNQILPKKDTIIEVKIQKFLKKLGIEFFTHQYIKEIEHGYQCDILIPSMNLVIECDGDYWHRYPIGLERDHIRTKELIENGFKVLRLWECEIKPMKIKDFQNKLIEVNNFAI